MYVSLREFARIKGWSPGYVSKLKSQGKLVMHTDERGKEMVDVAGSNARLNDARDPKKDYMQEVNQSQRPGYGRAPDRQPSANATFNNARTASEVYGAKLKQLEYEERAGTLVSAQVVRDALFRKVRIARDNLFAIPARLSAQLAAETDESAIRLLLMVELRRACEELAAGDVTEPRH